jgi:plastocyanin
MSRKIFARILFAMLVALLASGCGGQSLASSEVTFDISVIEIKGATDGIAPPEVDPVTLSQGYRYTPPGEYDESNPEKWQVSTYLFSPSAITVNQGDTVTLRLFVVNGDIHATHLEAPDGSHIETVTMNRGREYTITFTASQAGYYSFDCENHGPTMQMQILALPSG